MSNKAADIMATCTSFQIKLAGMQAENKIREMNGESLAYPEAAFVKLDMELHEELNCIHRHHGG